MPTLSTMRRSVEYAVRFLHTAAEGTECMTRQQINDLNLAVAMLRAAPDLIHNAPELCGLVEAGPADDDTTRALHRTAEKLRDAIERGTNREFGSNL